MSRPETALGTYQRWMRSVVTHPGNDSEAWMSEAAQAELPLPHALEFVESSPALSQMERVGIYRRMYMIRMRESLEMDYPGVLYATGAETFEQLVRDYCTVHPSQSYTLNHLGNSFPEFLRVLKIDHAKELAGLAAFELAMTNLLEANRVPALTPRDLRAFGQDGLEHLFLRTVPSLRLLVMDHRYHEFVRSAYQDDDVSFPPAKEDTWLVIYQDDEFDIVWKEIGKVEYVLLNAFTEGMTLAQGMNVLAETMPASVEDAAASVGGWLFEWLELEFFVKQDGHLDGNENRGDGQ